MLDDFPTGRKCCVANETSQRMNLESSVESQKRIFEIIGDEFFVTMDRHTVSHCMVRRKNSFTNHHEGSFSEELFASSH